MQLSEAEDLLKNTEDFSIVFSNVMNLIANGSKEDDNEYNITIQRDNISM